MAKQPSQSLIPVEILSLANQMYGPGLSGAGSEAIDTTQRGDFKIWLNPRGRYFRLEHGKDPNTEPQVLNIPMEQVNWWR